MKKIMIKGGKKLEGSIQISGAKNAALPILAASILPNEGKTSLSNVPIVNDIITLSRIMRKLGAEIVINGNSVLIDAENINNYILPLEESKLMRASVLMAGPLLTKYGEAVITEPGGCVIGKRPIDFHLNGFRQLGAKITEVNENHVKIQAEKLMGNRIKLPFPSVTATENLMMAACYADGTTTIENCAREPEIVDLASYLSSMGAKISGAGAQTIKITGVEELTANEYKVIPDRIETGTYIVAAAITKGEVTLKNAEISLLEAVVSNLREMGVTIEETDEGTRVTSTQQFKPIDIVTEVYPGFPTDMQAIITPLLCLADGKSTIKETIFEKRFNHVPEFTKMGADIKVHGDKIIINGVKKLRGSTVNSLDLRSGSSLIMAGLAAEGTTIIEGVQHILRGYEKPVEKLKNVGADISFLKE